MWLFDRKKSNSLTLLISNLNFSKHTITDRTEYPNFITTLHKIIIALANKVAIYGIEQEVVEDHEGIKRHAAVFQHKGRDEHAVVKQMLGHCCVYEWFVLLNIEGWVIKTLLHTTHHSSFRVRNETYDRDEGLEPRSTGVNFTKYKKDAQKCTSSYLLTNVAGRKSDGWHPLVEDFILVARKLEKQGFVYSKGEVLTIDPEEITSA